VVVGINRYGKWAPLEYAVNDARAVQRKLEMLGFDTVVTLFDTQATRHNILKLLGDWLPRQAQPEDRVLVFFAGHGQTEVLSHGEQMGFLIPVDGEPADYFSTAISMDVVRALSRRIAAKHIYYIIDACYSGLALQRGGHPVAYPVQRYLEKLTALPARQILTAGGKGEQVAEIGGHGLFTRQLLEALDGAADKDNDGVITASELGVYLRPVVSYASRNKQTPQFGHLDGQGEFVFLVGEGKQAEQTLRTEAKEAAPSQDAVTVPWPPEVRLIPPSEELPPEVGALAGIWEGAWDGILKSRLAVEQVEGQSARVVYAWAEHPSGRFKGGWVRVQATVLPPGKLQWGTKVQFTFAMANDHMSLEGERHEGGYISIIRMKKISE
jgi:uncharacterized caspase-like protein